MRYIELLPGLKPSVLGFGCAPILGSVDGETSKEALDVAWESGVNYFDVAPSYGYGEAEAFLGNALKGRRAQAFIATKFGIEAHPAARILSPLKSVVRQLRGAKPAPQAAPSGDGEPSAAGGGLAAKLLRRVPIDSVTMKRSVERSLRRMNTDYIDLLFVHEPLETVADKEALLSLSETLKKEGKIRAFGIATTYSDLQEFHSEWSKVADLLQIGVPTMAAEYEGLREERGSRSNVLFSAVRSRKAFSATGTPIPQAILELSNQFPKSVLLASMFNPEHIRTNCRAFDGNP